MNMDSSPLPDLPERPFQSIKQNITENHIHRKWFSKKRGEHDQPHHSTITR